MRSRSFGLGQRDDAALARIEEPREHVDRAALAGGVAAFEHDDHPLPGLGRPSAPCALSSLAIGFRSSSYSSSLSLLFPLIQRPLYNARCCTRISNLEPSASDSRARAGSMRPLRLAADRRRIRCCRLGWLMRRPRTFGAHAFALTTERQVVLVKLRYAPGWRLPGGGREAGEDPRAAVLRELREEIGMTSHGRVWLAAELDQDVAFQARPRVAADRRGRSLPAAALVVGDRADRRSADRRPSRRHGADRAGVGGGACAAGCD